MVEIGAKIEPKWDPLLKWTPIWRKKAQRFMKEVCASGVVCPRGIDRALV